MIIGLGATRDVLRPRPWRGRPSAWCSSGFGGAPLYPLDRRPLLPPRRPRARRGRARRLLRARVRRRRHPRPARARCPRRRRRPALGAARGARARPRRRCHTAFTRSILTSSILCTVPTTPCDEGAHETWSVLLRWRRDDRRGRRCPQPDGSALRQRRLLGRDAEVHRRRGRRRRARLRQLLDHRAPLPVRGLRGHPQRHPRRRPGSRPAPRTSASARCSTSCRSGTRCAWPRTSPRCTTSVGGRGILGVGRGTVPREILHLNDQHISIGSHDNPDQAADDTRNREFFEESMEVIRMSLAQGAVLVQRQVLPVPAARHPRPRRDRAAPHARARDRSTRTRSGRPSPARPPSSTCPSSITAPCSGTSTRRSSSACGTATASCYEQHQPHADRARRQAHAGGQRPHRGHARGSDAHRPQRPRRVLEVPRPVRLEPRLHGRRRPAGRSRA